MAHAKIEGDNKWITPRVSIGDKVLNSLANGAPVARAIAYVIEAMNFSTDKVNRFTNKTARENAKAVKESLTDSGKPGDSFVYSMPKAENLTEYVDVFSATRGDILKACDAIIATDAIMTEAEAKADEIRIKASHLKVTALAPMPVYSEGVRAKKSGTVLKI